MPSQVLSPEDLELDRACYVCKGSGFENMIGLEACDFCDGKGRIPTDFGEEILGFIRRNFKELLKEGLTGER